MLIFVNLINMRKYYIIKRILRDLDWINRLLYYSLYRVYKALCPNSKKSTYIFGIFLYGWAYYIPNACLFKIVFFHLFLFIFYDVVYKHIFVDKEKPAKNVKNSPLFAVLLF